MSPYRPFRVLVLGVTVVLSPVVVSATTGGKPCSRECRRQKRTCVKAFRGHLRTVKMECARGRNVTRCKQLARSIFGINRRVCKAALDGCSDCCRMEGAVSCSVAVCGDEVVRGEEECDGADDGACPGLCTAACECEFCGDGVFEPDRGEECDGTDDAECPGLCTAACECEFCGNGLVEPEHDEECEGLADQACPGRLCRSCRCTSPAQEQCRRACKDGRDACFRLLREDYRVAKSWCLDIEDLGVRIACKRAVKDKYGYGRFACRSELVGRCLECCAADLMPMCEFGTCAAGQNCSESEICDVRTCSSTGAVGFCTQAPPEPCPALSAPECGCDGVTYDNDCTRLRAAVPLAYPGPCLSEDGPQP